MASRVKNWPSLHFPSPPRLHKIPMSLILLTGRYFRHSRFLGAFLTLIRPHSLELPDSSQRGLSGRCGDAAFNSRTVLRGANSSARKIVSSSTSKAC
eukprot:3746193-Rhodomonas_salina.2